MSDELREMTSDIVSGYVSANAVPADELPALIKSIYATLTTLGQPEEPKAPQVEKITAAQIRKSITDDGLVSFIDGKRYKTLKRHLSGHGMTAVQYKERYGLPGDYPTTSPNYSAMRSTMAKSLGLGRKSGETKQVLAAAKKPVGRPKKAGAKATSTKT